MIATNRRYYLHRRLRLLMTVKARERTIELPTDVEPTLSGLVMGYLRELADAGYNIQRTIPN